MTSERAVLSAGEIQSVRADLASAEGVFLDRAGSLDAIAARSGSALPGWSRAHVVAHVTVLARALVRQCELAARGELGDVYDGGAEGREAAIDTQAAEDWEAIVVEAGEAFAQLGDAWPTDPEGWAAPVRHRDGTLGDILLTWWREVRIHLVDLGLGDGPDSWPQTLRVHLWDVLAPRLPGDESVLLRTTDSDLVLRSGPEAAEEPLTVVGTSVAVTAWLAGRDGGASLEVRRGTEPADLPELLPWVSSARRTQPAAARTR